ncbi:MAG: LysR family transcriptional regulator [Chloroflexi bacterium]|nr:LysR family transcriptional regulator [Chloroflexota bacterium]
MQPKFNLWLEADDEVVFSTWRAALLKAVGETGSISAAAAQMKIQYRTAWQKINEMETRLGLKLVETQVGGHHGGGATLTPAAQEYLDKFARFNAAVEKTVEAKYRDTFGSS